MFLGDLQLDTISGGSFAMDGGGVYGVVPRVIWADKTPPDEQNRVSLTCNCVLVRNGDYTALIETGYGLHASTREREMCRMEEGEPLLRSLAAVGVAPESIDAVIFGHLHFDHVGGATTFDDNGKPRLTFPNATYIASRPEWEDAFCGEKALSAAYLPELLEPIRESGQFRTVEDGEEMLPGIFAQVTGGHTRGHMLVRLKSGGQEAAYCGDIFPTAVHLRPLWSLAYDTNMLDARRAKFEFLEDAIRRQWWVLFAHDVNRAAAKVERVDGKLELVDEQVRL